jgi:hypothetical protein
LSVVDKSTLEAVLGDNSSKLLSSFLGVMHRESTKAVSEVHEYVTYDLRKSTETIRVSLDSIGDIVVNLDS